MLGLIRKILHKIRRIIISRSKRKALEILNNYKKGSPLYVEFLGTPGVGKSYIFNKIDKKKQGWIRLKEFCQLYAHEKNDSLTDSISFYQDLVKDKISTTLKRDCLATDYLRYFHYFNIVINRDALVYKFNKDATIISEEGLFHNFGHCIEKLKGSDKEKFNEILKNRAIIHCFAPAEVIADRIIKRKKENGKILPQHKVDSRKELLQIVNQNLQDKQRFTNSFKEYIPFLEINTADNIKQNVKKVEAFIEELQTSQRPGG